MKELQKMSWKEWVTKVSKDMQEDPMFAEPTEQVSQGLTFDWDQAAKDFVATGNIDKKVH
tara:strand:- start:993 stop:1172 length:180 start_codon:yes stop_codon:yes gene_type:complete